MPGNDYASLFEEAGRKYNVDPKLLMAVAAVESNFNPNAVGPQTKYGQAEGMMQIIPETAKSLGVADTKNPRDSIFGAAKLLSENLDRYGNVPDAVAAYHGGTDQNNWGPKTSAYRNKVMADYTGTPQQLSDDDLIAALTGKAPATPSSNNGGISDEELIKALTAGADENAPLSPSSKQKTQQKTGPQPTLLQTAAAGAPGRLLHDVIVQPIEGAASLASTGLDAAFPGLSGALSRATGQLINKAEAPYQEAIAAQQNRPGYAQAMDRAREREAILQQYGSGSGGLSNQVLAPFLPGFSGMMGGFDINQANANADLQTALQDEYMGQHPVASIVAQLAGGLMAGPAGLDRAMPTAAAGAATHQPGLIGELAGLKSGAGGRPISEAYRAGKASTNPAQANQAQAFQANLRGNVEPTRVLEQAKDALSALKQERNAAYRSGMTDISKDQTILSFEPIDRELEEIANVATYKGKPIAKKTADARQEVVDIITDWKNSDPAEFHTPEGFDALKQSLGDLRDSYPYGDRSRLVVDKAYNAVKAAIEKQAPAYAKVMRGYQEASDMISEIQKTLSQNPRASVDTQMRKLQSVMRNNVNTNYGRRAKLAEILNEKSGGTLMPALAGQALSSWTPRGIMRGVTGAELAAMLASAAIHNPEAAAGLAASLPLSSPRLMGEAAYYAGKAAGTAGFNAPLLSAPRVPAQLPYGLGASGLYGLMNPAPAR